MKNLTITTGFRAVLMTTAEVTDEGAEEFKKAAGYPAVTSEFLESVRKDMQTTLSVSLPQNTECQVSNFNVAYEITDIPEKENEKT